MRPLNKKSETTMALPPAIEALANVVKGYLNISEGAREFIRDDLPSNASGFSKFGQEALRRVCRGNARSGSWDPTLAPGKAIWGDLCQPYLSSIGEGATSGGSYGRPFNGGQCQNRAYAIKFDYSIINKNGVIIAQGSYGKPGAPQVSYGPLGWENKCVYRFGRTDLITGFTSRQTPTGPIVSGPNVTDPGGCDDKDTIQISNIEITAGSMINGVFYPGVDDCGNLPNTYTPPNYQIGRAHV